MTTARPVTRAAAALLALFATAALAPAQVKYPPPPEKVDVHLRYRITAGRDERVRQFRQMEANLNKLGFERRRLPGDEQDILDPTAERMEGVIPSKTVLGLLHDPRIQTILFRPTDFQYPDDPAKPIPVRILLASGLQTAEQHRLHSQAVAQLRQLGFREAAGYSHAGYTLVRGDIPAGNLFRLLKDLRTEPAGWFLPDTQPNQLPSPFRDALPIRAVEVLPGADLELLTVPPVPPAREKLTPDLRAVLNDQAAAAERPVCVEVVFDRHLGAAELELMRARLRSAYSRTVVNPVTRLQEILSTSVEGVVGTVVTVTLPHAADAERVATERGVVTVRLPRTAVQTVAALPEGSTLTPAADVLGATRVAAFHQLGYRGQGTRIIVLANEFPGLVTRGDARFLDANGQVPVTYIDLTAQLTFDLLPTPPAANPSAAGTAAARAAHLAAPGASIVLVRVDPAQFQVYELARFVAGETGYSQAMESRLVELSARADELRRTRDLVVEEYRRAFLDTSDEDAAVARRQRAREAFDALTKAETASALAINRAIALREAARAFSGASVVVNTLVWESGYALDGLSELSQYIGLHFASEAQTAPLTRSATRPRPPAKPIWVQAASPSAGSVWAGPFLDADGNGAMEFAGPDRPLPAGEWTRELSFLGERRGGMTTPTLPAGTRVRLTIQWRETHDPGAYGGLASIFPLTIRVFQQLDPEAKSRASDELKEVARSDGGPYLVRVEPTYGVYEQEVEFAVPTDGRYCVMVEGQMVFDPRLPALRRQLEIRPRMVVEFVGAAPDRGRPVFTEYAPQTAGVGMPGDAKAAITVGAAGTGLTGGGPGLSLLPKPDLVADGAIDVGAGLVGGPGVAAGFAVGVIADLVGSGAPPSTVIRATAMQPGGPAAIPEVWLRMVPHRPPPR